MRGDASGGAAEGAGRGGQADIEREETTQRGERERRDESEQSGRDANIEATYRASVRGEREKGEG